MATILPQVGIDATRLCDGDNDVNCYFDLKGCSTTNASIKCDDAGGWSASLAFVGNGVSVITDTTCEEDSCKWAIDGADGCPFARMFHATGLQGNDTTRHTLVVSSESNSTATTLEINNQTRIHTGPDTPVHPGDYVVISSFSTQVEAEGEWDTLEHLEGRPFMWEGWAIPRYLRRGKGSLSVGIVGDAFKMLWLAGPEDDNGPLVNLTINGEALAQDLSAVSYEDLKVSLDPGGWYNIGLTASLGAYNRTAQKSVGVYEISYYPLDNVTRIRDVVPEALIEAFSNGSMPVQSNELGCAERGSGSGAVSHLGERMGAVLLLPMLFVWFALRLKF